MYSHARKLNDYVSNTLGIQRALYRSMITFTNGSLVSLCKLGPVSLHGRFRYGLHVGMGKLSDSLVLEPMLERFEASKRK